MSKYYSIHEFSKIIGVSAQTLRNWDANGKLHIVSVELERAVPLIDRGASVDEHQHTVLRFEVQKLCQIGRAHV